MCSSSWSASIRRGRAGSRTVRTRLGASRTHGPNHSALFGSRPPRGAEAAVLARNAVRVAEGYVEVAVEHRAELGDYRGSLLRPLPFAVTQREGELELREQVRQALDRRGEGAA